MEEILLKDICDLDNGYAFKSDDYVESSNTLNCRMSNIRPDGSFDILYSAKYLPDEFVKKYKNYVLNDGDLIIAMTDMAGDPKILGVPTVVDTKGYKLLLNQRVGRLRFIRDGINADYLKFALQCKRVRDYLKMFAGGGVQLNVSKKDILNAPIMMRAIGEQQSIADLLKRIIKLQKLREQELQHFDNLIKARFVEMFGDFESNSKQLEIETLGQLGFWSSGGTPSRTNPDYFTGNINWYTAGELNSLFLDESVEKITKEAINNSAAKLFKAGSMLVGMYDTAAFKMGILKEDSASNQACACIEPNERIDIVWLYYALTMMKNHYLFQRRGVRQKNLNLGMIKGFKLPIAQKNEQLTFVSFVKQIDKSKVAIQKSLAETQLLFDKLMQDYFG